MRIIEWVLLAALLAFSLSGCGRTKEEPAASELPTLDAESQSLEENPMETTKPEGVPVLLYMGQASMQIVTAENKVIYIDPYAGDAYDLPADLILVTHDHFDHCAVDRVEMRSEDCKIITQVEALENGEHQTFSKETPGRKAGRNGAAGTDKPEKERKELGEVMILSQSMIIVYYSS